MKRTHVRAAVAALLALRAAFLFRLFLRTAHGFFFYSGDYPTRVLMAWDWAKHPAWLFDGIWLPVNFYLTGIVLKIWPDTLRAPTFFHILLSTGLLGLVFALGRELCGDDWCGLAAVSPFIFEPMLTMLSISGGCSELDFQFSLVAAVLFWARWRRRRRGADLAALSAFLALAGGIRHEAWCFMAFPCLDILAHAWRSGIKEKTAAAAALILIWLIPALWWRAHILLGLYPLVAPSKIVANLTGGIATPDGQRWPWARACLMYFAALWQTSPLLVAASALALCVGVSSELKGLAFYVAASTAFMGLASVLSRLIPIPLERIIVPIQLLLGPLCASAVLLARRIEGRRKSMVAAALVAIAGGLVIYNVRNALRTPRLLMEWRPLQDDVYDTMLGLVKLRAAQPEARVLWQVQMTAPVDEPNRLWVHTLARYADPTVVADRADTVPTVLTPTGWVLQDRSPGLLDLPSAKIKENLAALAIDVAVVHTSAAEAKLSPFMAPAARVGQYAIFVDRARPPVIEAVAKLYHRERTP